MCDLGDVGGAFDEEGAEACEAFNRWLEEKVDERALLETAAIEAECRADLAHADGRPREVVVEWLRLSSEAKRLAEDWERNEALDQSGRRGPTGAGHSGR